MSKTHLFDASHYLNDVEDIAAYLQAAIEDKDPALLAAALGDIARARDTTQLAPLDCLGKASTRVCRQAARIGC